MFSRYARTLPAPKPGELAIHYGCADGLDKTVHDLLIDISQEAEMHNCFIEADAWEEGTERHW